MVKKFIVLVALALLSASALRAQTYGTNTKYPSSISSPVLLYYNGLYYHVVNASDWGTQLLVTNAIGVVTKTLAATCLPSAGFMNSNHHCVMTGNVVGSCFGNPTSTTYFWETDPASQILYTIILPVKRKVVSTFEAPDHTYFALTDSVLLHISNTGAVLSNKYLQITQITGAAMLTATSMVVSGNYSGSPVIAVTDTAGTILKSVVVPSSLRYLVLLPDQSIVGNGADGQMYKLSTGLQIVSKTSNPFMKFGQFTFDNDSLYCLSSDSGRVGVASLDTAFHVIKNVRTLPKNVFQLALHHRPGGKLTILSNVRIIEAVPTDTTLDKIYDHTEYNTSFNMTDMTRGNNFRKNVTLTSAVVDSIHDVGEFSNYAYGDDFYFHATVRNDGVDTIRTFRLMYRWDMVTRQAAHVHSTQRNFHICWRRETA